MGPQALALTGCLVAGPVAGWAAMAMARALVWETRPPAWLYLVCAAACAVLFAWAWAVTPPGRVLIASMVLAWGLLALAVSDIASLRLPDPLTLPLATAGLAAAWLLPAADGVFDHVVGALAGYGGLALIAWAYRRLRGREGIGMGDAKLMAAAGAWLGWRALPSVLIIGCLLGLLWWSLARLRPISARGGEIPFGAALGASLWIVWLYGPLQSFNQL